MSSRVECFKCWKSRWHATGRIEPNRHGRQRALLICEACAYSFWSPDESAIEAANAIRTARGEEPIPYVAQMPIVPIATPTPAAALVRQPSLPGSRRPGFVPVGVMATDYRRRQAGEREAGEDD